jgi:hypothetical protein
MKLLDSLACSQYLTWSLMFLDLSWLLLGILLSIPLIDEEGEGIQGLKLFENWKENISCFNRKETKRKECREIRFQIKMYPTYRIRTSDLPGKFPQPKSKSLASAHISIRACCIVVVIAQKYMRKDCTQGIFSLILADSPQVLFYCVDMNEQMSRNQNVTSVQIFHMCDKMLFLSVQVYSHTL